MVYQRPLRSDELMHFGVKGMHWGVRRYQNEDGSYTSAGRKHYNIGAAINKKRTEVSKKIYGQLDANDKSVSSTTRKVRNDYNNMNNAEFYAKYHTGKGRYKARTAVYKDPYKNGIYSRIGRSKLIQTTGKAMAPIATRGANVGHAMLRKGTYDVAGSTVSHITRGAGKRLTDNGHEKAGSILSRVGKTGASALHTIGWARYAQTRIGYEKNKKEINKSLREGIDNEVGKAQSELGGSKKKSLGDRYSSAFDKKNERYNDRIDRAKHEKEVSGKIFGKDSSYTKLFDQKIDKLESEKKYHHDETMRDKNRFDSARKKQSNQSEMMKPRSSDSAVTKRVKKQWAELSDDDFKKVSGGVSKEEYAKRVEKYGDPYMNSPMAKMGKALSKKKRR